MSPLHCGSPYPSRDQQGEADEVGYVETESSATAPAVPRWGRPSRSPVRRQPEHGLSHVGGHRVPDDVVQHPAWLVVPQSAESGNGTLSPHFSLTYLAAELFGMASDKSSFVMVSDGGHFENMAAYELIRRKCRVIVISDGECDVDYTFGGLGTLIRVCEVDFRCRDHYQRRRASTHRRCQMEYPPLRGRRHRL